MKRLLYMCCLMVSSASAQHNDLELLKSKIEDSTLLFNDRVDLYNELSYPYYRISSDTMLIYASMAQNLARKIQYAKGLAIAYANVGVAYREKSQFELSMTYLDSALALSIKINDDSLVSDILKRKGVIYRFMGDYSAAIESYLEAIKIKRSINDEIGLGHTLGNLGIVYQNLGEYDSAYAYFVKSIDLKRRTNDELGLSSTFLNIGKVKLFLGDYKVAEEYLEASLSIKKSYNDIRGQAFVYEYLGDLKSKLGNTNEALAMYQKSTGLYRVRNDLKGISSIYDKMGELYVKMEKFQLATGYLKEALLVKKEINDKQGTADVYLHMAHCSKGLKQEERALKLCDTSISMADKIGYVRGVVHATGFKHELLVDQEKYAEAYEALLIHHVQSDSLLNIENLKEAGKLETLYRASQLQNENKLLQKEKVITNGRLMANTLELKQQRLFNTSLIVICLLITVLAISWFRFNMKKKKAILLLKQHSQEIVMQRDKISSQAFELKGAYEEIKEMNLNLENTIEERTKQLVAQNKKLMEYTYSNSHVVRAPLSRILALIGLFEFENCDPEEIRFICKNINLSALELDQTLKDINKVLEEEGVV